MAKIHPTAIVQDGARLGADVEIGPYAHIGAFVSIGDGTVVKQGAIIDGHTTIGSCCQIFPYACIGMKTQDLKYKEGSISYVEIGDRTVLREFVTIHSGTLRKAGIETRGLIAAENVFTTLAFVTLDETKNREFSFSRKPGADTCLSFEEIDLRLIDETKVFHFGTLSLTDEPARSATYRAVEYAKKGGKLITYDPNLRKPLWKDLKEAKIQLIWGLTNADVVKISDEEVEFLFGLGAEEGAAYILENFGVKLVFVTRGADGCYYKNKSACGYMPGLDGISVMDTTGAGDIFGGSAVWKLLQSDTRPEDLNDAQLRDITAFACTAAGLSTTKSGGICSVPEYESVLKLLPR